ncbi:MAG: peptidase, family [Bacteroidetes bacterium]|nr:peptidase, family [Bacteroidota bacterium]
MPKKVKYIFDPHSLSFKIKTTPLKEKIKNLSFSMAFGLVFAVVFSFVIYYFVDSPKEKILKSQLQGYEIEYDRLEKKVDLMSDVLEDIEYRDNNVYRVIFMAEPLDDGKRKGVGSNEKYQQILNSTKSELIVGTAKKVDELTRRLYSQTKSIDELFNMAKTKKERFICMPAILPLAKDVSSLSSGFGLRYHPILQIKRMHTGIDFTAPTGTPIHATADGVVVEADRSGSGYGNAIKINHGFGFETLYAHLQKINVAAGKKVKRGDIIGLVGSTGLSQAPHLHYEVHQNGKQVNPVFFFFNDLSAEEYEQVLELANKENQSLS